MNLEFSWLPRTKEMRFPDQQCSESFPVNPLTTYEEFITFHSQPSNKSYGLHFQILYLEFDHFSLSSCPGCRNPYLKFHAESTVTSYPNYTSFLSPSLLSNLQLLSLYYLWWSFNPSHTYALIQFIPLLFRVRTKILIRAHLHRPIWWPHGVL